MEISYNMFLGTVILGFVTLFISCGILIFMTINTVTENPQAVGQTEEQQAQVTDGQMRRMPRINNSVNNNGVIYKKYWKNTII